MPVKLPIYLDYHSTTPCDGEVVAAMLPFFSEIFGNASSRQHVFGWKAEEAVESARDQVAGALGADGKEIVFTSGATEANNLAIRGAMEFYREKGRHIVTVATEHKAVLDPIRRLASQGCEVTLLPVDAGGHLNLDDLRRSLRADTVLVSVMSANNEIGTLHPVAEIGALCRAAGVLFHTDATQALGNVGIDVEAMNIDLLSLSGHKIYGPKGVGALYVRRRPRVRLLPIIDGGGHERGMRSGTLPVPLIVGIGKACELLRGRWREDAARVGDLRDRFLGNLRAAIPELHVNGSLDRRLPNNLNVSFPDVDGEALMLAMKDVAVSSGSACTSATLEPSYVLRAIGLSEAAAHSSLRFGLGRLTTADEIAYATECVISAMARVLRTSAYAAAK